ncbi:hypothetical protein KP509_27G011400 [Ceratopteris richardii]|nr:hypothetical protein KP509_27G011400 [Ceratopteris richardii]
MNPDLSLLQRCAENKAEDSANKQGHVSHEHGHIMDSQSSLNNQVVDAVNEQGFSTYASVYTSLLQRCTENKSFAEGEQLHSWLVATGLESDSAVGAPLIRMYTFFGKTEEAWSVFSNLSKPNSFAWSAIISAYAKLGQIDEVFKLYTCMQNSTSELDGHGFTAVLQACSISSDIQWGRKVHNHIIESGWDKDIFVGSTLIDMYSSCRCVADAHAVFDRLPRGNLVTWSALMKGYAQLNQVNKVIEIYKQMRQQGLDPDEVTFIGILKASSSSVFGDAQQIHADIVERGFEQSLWVSNALIHFYVRCDDLVLASGIFNKMPEQGPVAYSTLMAGYTQCNQGHQALQLYERSQKHLVEADAAILVCTLKACISLTDLDYGERIHSCIIDCGFEDNMAIGSTVIDFYAKCGDLSDAQRHFLRLPTQNIVTWNALITGYSQQENKEMVLQLFDQLQAGGLSPDSVTLGAILKTCSNIGTLENSRCIHIDLVKRGLDVDNSISNALIDTYAKHGRIAEAHIIFNSLLNKDIVAWSSLIGGYIQHGQCDEAFQLFESVQLEGLRPDPVMFACILKACCSSRDLEQGRQLNAEIVCGGWEEDVFLGNALVDMYAKCGNLEDACRVLCKLEDRSTVGWNSLISGYLDHGDSQEALRLFKKMGAQGVDKNIVTYICCLKACSNLAALEHGRHIHRCMINEGYEMDVVAGSTLINMYSNCGSLEDAQILLQRLIRRNTVAWSALISGHAQHNEYYAALRCFQQMEEEGFKPDNIAFLCLLSACSGNPCLVDEGCRHFKSMLHDHHVQPSIEHYNSMVQIFGHADRLNLAEDLVETIPFQTNSTTWTSLLNACKRHGNVLLGRRCFDQLIRIDPENAAGHILMAGVYTQVGMLENARELEELRRHSNGWKKPAKAFIEIDNEVHSFVVGDQAHPRSSDIQGKIISLNMQMMKESYQPCTETVVDTVTFPDKAATLCGHSERLAIAFGLISTAQGTTIRVSKNLRMCLDCHQATKFISKLEMREIIVADTYCVHHFDDGECSCQYDHSL